MLLTAMAFRSNCKRCSRKNYLLLQEVTVYLRASSTSHPLLEIASHSLFPIRALVVAFTAHISHFVLSSLDCSALKIHSFYSVHVRKSTNFSASENALFPAFPGSFV